MRRALKGYCSRCHVPVPREKLVWRGNLPPLCAPCNKDVTGQPLGVQQGRAADGPGQR